MPLPDHFDLIAGCYDILLSSANHQALAAMLGLRTGQVLLDIGGGTGRVAHAMAAEGVRVIVVDQSRPMLRHAHAKHLTTVRARAGDLPFPDNSMEGVLVVDAFHHFAQPAAAVGQPRAVREMLRVLRPGCRLVIEEPDARRLIGRAVAVGEAILRMGSRLMAPETLISLCEAYGGDLVALEQDSWSVRLGFVKRA